MERIAINEAGMESLARSQSRLQKNQNALEWLVTTKGLIKSTIDKYRLGLSGEIKSKGNLTCFNALSAPVLAADGEPKRRRVYGVIPKITVNPKIGGGWAVGEPLVYYSDSIGGKKRVFVCDWVFDVWRLDQEFSQMGGFDDLLFVCSTHQGILPEEFCTSEFWEPFEEIYAVFSPSEHGDRITENLRKICPADIKRIVPPGECQSWVDFFNNGGTVRELAGLMRSAETLKSAIPETDFFPKDQTGEFAIDPIDCNSAFAGGYYYYAYRVEKRETERIKHRDGTINETNVTSYQVKVLRSDGVKMDIDTLPAPRGTPAADRVVALSDGTRIERKPQPNPYSSWPADAIDEFIRRRHAGQKVLDRTFGEILADLEAHFRWAVWLPFDEDYAVIALYSALSFVYNVFDAIPLLIVNGPKGTGKSDLGGAFETVSFNACGIGQSSPAAAVRIINESRGLIVWDDLEALADGPGKDAFSELRQMLKLSYKKKTARKIITDRRGQSSVFNFFGPKVINNTRGVDRILGSRMLTVLTAPIPFELRGKIDLTGSEPEQTVALRNELHAWGMDAANEIHELYQKLIAGNRGSRHDEILAPLRAVALHSGDKKVLDRLERAARRESEDSRQSVEPIDLLREALEQCVGEGFSKEVSLPHLQLQIALLASLDQRRLNSTVPRFWKNEQWIGHAMQSFGLREEKVPVRRARLHGKETRIYRLKERFVGACFERIDRDVKSRTAAKTINPFDFCRPGSCADCVFANICEETVPGLMPAKMKRSRKFE
jgi:hypothetical protein